jgi:hypothetical protein
MPGKPSFLKDPDQGAELAALLQDTADDHQDQLQDIGGACPRSDLARHEQTIARYRRWAAELVTEPETEASAPVQIRPARQGGGADTEATG